MPVVRTLVVLATYGDHGTIHRPMNAAWFHDYFFNPIYGQKAYWLKQSDNEIVLDGQVIDWRHYPFGSFDIMNRSLAGTAVFNEVRNSLGLNLSQYDLPIVVFGLPPQIASDGGAAAIEMEEGRTERGVVGRTETAFDFWAHEIGHGIDLEHSFGKDPIPREGEAPGGYGHPHCIMSAQAYGGFPNAGGYYPPQLRDGRVEYGGLGPGINAATALHKGWVNAHYFDNKVPRDFRIRSRNDGGRNSNRLPQALSIRSKAGFIFVVEYRENIDWDRAQDRPYLIVTQSKGGLADISYPNMATGTFETRLGLPLNPSAPWDNWLEVWDFAIRVLEVDLAGRTVLLRVYPNGPPSLNLSSSTAVTGTNPVVVEVDEYDFKRGKVRCVEGLWHYKKIKQSPQAVFEVRWLSSEPVQAHWTIWGEPAPLNGKLVKMSVKVRMPTPQMVTYTNVIDVEVHCLVTPLPNGSRLTVTCTPDFHVFTLDARVVANSASAYSTEEFQAEMACTVIDYGEEFEERRMRCLTDLTDPASHFPTYEVEIDFDGWRDIPRPKLEEARLLLKYLAQLHSDGKAREFKKVSAELAALAGREEIALAIVALADRLDTSQTARRPIPGCTLPLLPKPNKSSN